MSTETTTVRDGLLAQAEGLLAAGTSYRATARVLGIPRTTLHRLIPNTTQKATAEERFWSRVDATGDCWTWAGSRTAGGYGNLRVEGGWDYAHRVSYRIHVGPIPDGLTIDHLCRNKLCVNPTHLEPVTLAENVRRANAAITHCPSGHAYTTENTYIDRRGGRRCRACASALSATRRRGA